MIECESNPVVPCRDRPESGGRVHARSSDVAPADESGLVGCATVPLGDDIHRVEEGVADSASAKLGQYLNRQPADGIARLGRELVGAAADDVPVYSREKESPRVIGIDPPRQKFIRRESQLGASYRRRLDLVADSRHLDEVLPARGTDAAWDRKLVDREIGHNSTNQSSRDSVKPSYPAEPGSVTVKTAPPETAVPARMLPPRRPTRRAAIERPRPVPTGRESR